MNWNIMVINLTLALCVLLLGALLPMRGEYLTTLKRLWALVRCAVGKHNFATFHTDFEVTHLNHFYRRSERICAVCGEHRHDGVERIPQSSTDLVD